VHCAQERAQANTGVAFTNSRTVLIGDTPKDVAAGITAGVQVIGVASGKSSEDELWEAGSEQVIPDLRRPERLHDLLIQLAWQN
jgi:phosphoglycolate phosphatase